MAHDDESVHEGVHDISSGTYEITLSRRGNKLVFRVFHVAKVYGCAWAVELGAREVDELIGKLAVCLDYEVDGRLGRSNDINVHAMRTNNAFDYVSISLFRRLTVRMPHAAGLEMLKDLAKAFDWSLTG